MSTEKRNKMDNDDRSNQPSKNGGQQKQNPDKKQFDSKADLTKRGSGMNQSKFDKQDYRNNGGKKNIDAERHPEEQVAKPEEYNRDDQEYDENSERV